MTNSRSHFFRTVVLFFCATLISLTGSSYWIALKSEISSNLKSIDVSNPLIALNIGDSSMYILQSYAFSVNLNLVSETEALSRLSMAGLDLLLPSTRDQLYLAHVDRSRILYPLLSSLGRIFFGDYTFLLINLFSLFGILYLLTLRIKKLNYVSVSLLAFLISSPIFNYLFYAIPEMLCYFLLALFIYLCSKYLTITEQRSLKKFAVGSSLCLVALLCTKPIFVITIPVTLLFYTYTRNRVFLYQLFLSVASCGAWLLSSKTNFTPSELLNKVNSLAKITHWNLDNLLKNGSNTGGRDNFVLQKSMNSLFTSPYRLVSEINGQITLNQKVSFVGIFLAIYILVTNKAYKSLGISLSVFFGAILTQGYSGSYAINLRYINYGVIVLVMSALFESNNKIDALQTTNNDIVN